MNFGAFFLLGGRLSRYGQSLIRIQDDKSFERRTNWQL